MYRNGYPAYYITVQREYDANTVAILDGVNAAIDELNAGPLADAGLAIDLSFDASVHIRRVMRRASSREPSAARSRWCAATWG